ncbi:uncharacterized protein WCC33_003024 [Rhinophrynus dorsalis]
MAPFQGLSLWQKILLGIFFPLLPFYLCAYCLCLKKDAKKQEGNHQDVGYEEEEGRKVPKNKTEGFQKDEESKQDRSLRDAALLAYVQALAQGDGGAWLAQLLDAACLPASIPVPLPAGDAPLTSPGQSCGRAHRSRPPERYSPSSSQSQRSPDLHMRRDIGSVPVSTPESRGHSRWWSSASVWAAAASSPAPVEVSTFAAGSIGLVQAGPAPSIRVESQDGRGGDDRSRCPLARSRSRSPRLARSGLDGTVPLPVSAEVYSRSAPPQPLGAAACDSASGCDPISTAPALRPARSSRRTRSSCSRSTPRSERSSRSGLSSEGEDSEEQLERRRTQWSVAVPVDPPGIAAWDPARADVRAAQGASGSQDLIQALRAVLARLEGGPSFSALADGSALLPGVGQPDKETVDRPSRRADTTPDDKQKVPRTFGLKDNEKEIKNEKYYQDVGDAFEEWYVSSNLVRRGSDTKNLPLGLSAGAEACTDNFSSSNGDVILVRIIAKMRESGPSLTNYELSEKTSCLVKQQRLHQEGSTQLVTIWKEEMKRAGYPSKLKSIQIDLKSFEKLDAYASKVIANRTLDLLVKDLLCETSTDLERTRAIWIWMCHYIEYDVAALKNKALVSNDPEVIFRTRKAVCTGYASLLQQMCSIAGVKCKTVSGYSKGVGYKLGQTFTGDTDHTWNMVYLEGSWHLLDSTWGAGHVDDKFTFQYNEFYFLTHPALFIEDHFPQEAHCQLLEPHLTLQQFEKSAHRRSHFYSLGMLSSNPDTAVIETVKGKASVTIESHPHLLFIFNLSETEKSGLMRLTKNGVIFDVYPQRSGQHTLQIFAKARDTEEAYQLVVDYRVDCKTIDTSMRIPKCLSNPVGPHWLSEKAGLLLPSHPDPVINLADGCCTIGFTLDRELKLTNSLKCDEIKAMPNHVIQKWEKSKVEFNVRLPHAGSYVLQIFDDSTGYICNYLLTCFNLKVKWPSFPSLLLNPVGPSPETEKAGLLEPSHPEPIIDTEDGCCCISFTLDRVLKLSSSLKSEDLKTIPNHVIQRVEKHKVEFNVRLPQAGSYVFQIFGGSTGYICNYLLTCSNHKVKWSPFPSLLLNPVGPSPETEEAGLHEPSHPEPIITTDNGLCTISFTLDRMLYLTCSLKSDEIENIPNHIIQRSQKDKVEFNVHLPRAGSYVLQVFGGPSGYICNYLLLCSNPKVKWPPFPSALHNPVGPSPETVKVGLVNPSHPDPIIHTENGCCTISFELQRELNIFSTLHTDDIQSTSGMEHRHIFQTKKENIFEIKVRLPRSGTYIIRLNIKMKNTNVYTSQCNYMITCKNTTVQWPVFPLAYEDWAEHYELVEPLDGVLPENSTVPFKLLIPGVTGVSVKGKTFFPLTLSELGYWEGTCNTADCREVYVIVYHKDKPNTSEFILQYQVGGKSL